MFGSFRRHQQWIWILGMIVIIPTFLVWGTYSGKFNGDRQGKIDLGSFNNRSIGRDEYIAAMKETRLNYFMRTGGKEWPGSDEATKRNLDRDTIFRIFLLEKINELEIHVSPQAVARAGRERLGEYPPEKFENDFLRAQELTLEDFKRYI